jgi:hypothetical protein
MTLLQFESAILLADLMAEEVETFWRIFRSADWFKLAEGAHKASSQLRRQRLLAQ